MPTIPKIIALLSDEEVDVCWQAAESLGILSEQGKMLNLVVNYVDKDCS